MRQSHQKFAALANGPSIENSVRGLSYSGMTRNGTLPKGSWGSPGSAGPRASSLQQWTLMGPQGSFGSCPNGKGHKTESGTDPMMVCYGLKMAEIIYENSRKKPLWVLLCQQVAVQCGLWSLYP